MAFTDEIIRLNRAFGRGIMRQNSIDLTFLPRASNEFKAQKTTTGKAFNDFVSQQASGLGLDPEIFLYKQA